MALTQVLWSTVLCMCFGNIVGDKPSVESQVLAVNDFAVDLYRVLSAARSGRDNLFWSPYSVYTALAMTEVGTRRNTQKELRNALNWMEFLSMDVENGGHSRFSKFNKIVLSGGQNKKKFFHLANKAWLQKYFQNTHMKTHFTAKLKKFYGIDVGTVNFIADPEAARQQINQWVEKQTNDKIKDLIKSGVLTQLTRLVLTNAVHFKDAWKIKFQENRTREMNFNVDSETTVPVKMMFVKSKFRYAENEQCKVVELPYSGGDVSMVVLVPKEDVKLSEIDEYISAGVIQKLVNDMVESDVTVRIPKFKLESGFDLNTFLSKLGVRDLFDPNTADLSGILGVKGLYISKVIHKAFVDVSEEGTEAAAATAVVATFRSLDPLRKFLIADRPFLFIIRDQKTGAILFMGKLVNPRQ